MGGKGGPEDRATSCHGAIGDMEGYPGFQVNQGLMSSAGKEKISIQLEN